MKQVPYPEEGDQVFFKDGRTGSVSGEPPISQEEGDWQIEVEDIADKDGEGMVDEEQQTEQDVSVSWSSEREGWVEV